MGAPIDQELVQLLLVEYGPEEIRRSYPQLDTCILSTSVAIDVLDYFRIRARPLSVVAVVGNAPYYEQFQNGGLGNIDDDWWDRTGAYSVGLGFSAPPMPGKHPTHLIAITAKYLIDLAIDQANRPDRGINVVPLMFPTEGVDLFQGDHILVAKNTDDGGVVIYLPKPFDLDYVHFPDWYNKKKRHDIVGRIIKRIKHDLK